MLFFSIHSITSAQIQEKNEPVPVSKNEIIRENKQLNTETKGLTPEDVEKLKISKSTPAVFYIINDKPVSREEYLLHLIAKENEKNKETNPKP
jgi:hypothetical protein